MSVDKGVSFQLQLQFLHGFASTVRDSYINEQWIPTYPRLTMKSSSQSHGVQMGSARRLNVIRDHEGVGEIQ